MQTDVYPMRQCTISERNVDSLIETARLKRSTVGVYCLRESDAESNTRCLESTQNLNGLIASRGHSR